MVKNYEYYIKLVSELKTPNMKYIQFADNIKSKPYCTLYIKGIPHPVHYEILFSSPLRISLHAEDINLLTPTFRNVFSQIYNKLKQKIVNVDVFLDKPRFLSIDIRGKYDNTFLVELLIDSSIELLMEHFGKKMS